MMVSSLFLAFNALLPKIDFNSFSAFLNSRDRWMAQLLYDKHRPPTLFLIIGAAGMMYFWVVLRRAINEGSGIKTSGIIAGWALVLYLIVHGPISRIVNEHSSMRPFAEKIKLLATNRPIYKYGKIREDLFYYLDGQIKEVYEDTTELFQQPEALLIVRKTHEPVWLQDFPREKIILETNAGFETYMLIEKKEPPISN